MGVEGCDILDLCAEDMAGIEILARELRQVVAKGEGGDQLMDPQNVNRIFE